jgi:beta-glucosidase
VSRGRRGRGRHGRRRPLAGLTIVMVAFALVAGTAALTWASGAIQGPAPTSAASIPPVNGGPVVNALLSRMSLAEKLRLLEWVAQPGQPQSVTLPGVRRLGIPALHLAEGSLGTPSQPAAAMTAPLGVAATFSRADAYANGVVLGRDARSLGQQAVARPFGVLDSGGAGPAAAGTYGEDPLLAGGTAAAEIAGIQAQGTMAVVGGYPGSTGAAPSSAALREIYLQPYEDAVRAGAAGVLCSPAGATPDGSDPAASAGAAADTAGTGGTVGAIPPAADGHTAPDGSATAPAGSATASPGTAAGPGTASDGRPAGPATGPAAAASSPGTARKPAAPAPCGSPGLLIQVLRSELGFTGFVLAGPGANPGTLSLDSGLDGEVPAAGRVPAGYFTPAALRAAIAGKAISARTVNQAVTEVLAEMNRFGLLRPQPAHRAPAEPVGDDERVISRTAADAATLLKNAGHALPLSTAAQSSLALIGPGAYQVVGADAAGGNGGGVASRQPGTLQALRQDLAPGPASRLTYAVGDDMTGSPVPAAALTHDGHPGLVRSTPGHAARVVSTLDNTLAGHDALAPGSAHTWTGELTVPASGTYWISLGTGGSWGALTLDGTVVAQDGPGQAAAPATGSAPATGATPSAAAPAPAGAALVPTTDGLENLRARVTLTAGTHTIGVSESADGSGRPVQVRLNWVTPAAQQAGLAAAMADARTASAAVVFAWGAGGAHLPDGQDQLIGDVAAVNPDTVVVLNTPGPVTMPWLHAVRAVLEMWYPGDGGGAATAGVLLGRDDPGGRLPVTWPASRDRLRPDQSAGIFVGYRRYDQDRIAPLFPFGYGLSYTRFGYSALTWRAVPGRGLVARFVLTNTGQLAGAAVPQLYLGPPARVPPGAAFAPRALAAYTRVSLPPGQSRVVTLTVPERQLQYWQDARGWVTAAGQRRLYVGSDERATALTATVTIPR